MTRRARPLCNNNRTIIGFTYLLVLTCGLIVAATTLPVNVAADSWATTSPPERDNQRVSTHSAGKLLGEKAVKLPIRFEENHGQTDLTAKYVVRNNGYTVFYTPSEIVFVLSGKSPQRTDRAVVRLKLAGANKVEVAGEDRLAGVTNYFLGKDPAKWQTNVPAFGRIRYRNIYNGIDLIHYGNERGLEYDFVVGPGANPRDIRLQFSEGASLFITNSGALVSRTRSGDLKHTKPVAYQLVNGEKRIIDSRFTKRGRAVGFVIGNYDKTLPLTIDPALTYSTFLGGSGSDLAVGVAVDSAGNAYVTGSTSSLDFPTVNPINSTSVQGDVFVSKLNATGSALIFSTYIGGNFFDSSKGIAVDSLGNAYVTGATQSTNFPTSASAIQTTLKGNSDAFVTKLNSTGALVYSTYLGGTDSSIESGNDIAVDTSGQAYIVGETSATDFPTPNGVQPTKGSGFNSDAFVSKLNAAGNALVYSTYLGGSSEDSGHGIAVDSSGNAYATGATFSTNFPVANAIKSTSTGGDAFVTKLSAAGSTRIYSTYFGGTNGSDKGNDIAVDSSGAAYITGSTFVSCCDGNNFPTVNAVQPTAGSFVGEDGFVSKISPAGDSIVYSTYLGGSFDDHGNRIAVDSSGNAYVTGYTLSTNFPTSNALMPANSGNSDAFITKIGAAGNTFGFSSYLGSRSYDEGRGVALDSGTNIFVVGGTNLFGNDTHNFPTTAGAFQTVGHGTSTDGFVAKINQAGVSPYIQGVVTHSSGAILPNVAMSLTGAQTKSALTDQNGAYVFQLLPAGTYTVTPGNYNYAFSPANLSFPNLNTPQTSAHFSGVTLLNDNFANAIPLSGTSGSVFGANFGGTKQCTERPHAGGEGGTSVWYRWHASASRVMFFNTRESNIDTLLAVYTGSNLDVCNLPAPVASNDDGDGDSTSPVSFSAIAGNDYFIAIDARFFPGPFKLSFAPAITISGKITNVNGRGLAGIPVDLNGDQTASTSTNSLGAYSFTVAAGGNYTVRPDDGFIIWNVPSYEFAGPTQNIGNADFRAFFPAPTIFGFINNLTQGIADLSITVGGSGLPSNPCSITMVDTNVGRYTCTGLNIRGDYEVTPSSAVYNLTPTVRPFFDIRGTIFEGLASEFNASLASPPTAVTSAASAVTVTSATLNGTVNPNGKPATAWFEWGTSPTLATSTSTATQNIGDGSSAVTVGASLTGLTGGTTYFFRAVGMSGAGTTRGAILSFTLPVQITVQTNPVGRTISIDGGAALIAPQVVQWIPGSAHTIGTTTPQNGSSGTRYVWSSWNDGGAIAHQVTAPSAATTYTANFTTQHQLTMNAGSGGSVQPVSGSFFNSGQTVQITATPNSGFTFSGWSGTGAGSFTGSTNPASVTMNGPITQLANFSSVTTGVQTPVGQNVSVTLNGVTVTFASVTGAGTTAIPSVVPSGAGQLPNSYQLTGNSIAFDISTTAVVRPPITVCFKLQSVTNATTFSQLRILHKENGSLVDRTASHDFATKMICASVSSLSPFVLASTTVPLWQLLLEESGAANHVAAIDSVLFLRDPFPVINLMNLLRPGPDRNTRVLVFVKDLQLAANETAAAVTVNLVGSNNQSYNITAEDVRVVPQVDFSQIRFRLPDTLAPGACTIQIRAHGQVSNSGFIQIRQ